MSGSSEHIVAGGDIADGLQHEAIRSRPMIADYGRRQITLKPLNYAECTTLQELAPSVPAQSSRAVLSYRATSTLDTLFPLEMTRTAPRCIKDRPLMLLCATVVLGQAFPARNPWKLALAYLPSSSFLFWLECIYNLL